MVEVRMDDRYDLVWTAEGGADRPFFVVDAERDGRFWFLRVRDRPELFTQTVRLDRAKAMVRDLIATWDDIDPTSFAVFVLPVAPAEARELVDAASKARVAASAAAARSAIATRAAARALVDAGLTVRDAGAVLGVTHQRVAQLVAMPPPDPSSVADVMDWHMELMRITEATEHKPSGRRPFGLATTEWKAVSKRTTD
jgi:hypothetical protein